MCYNPLNLLRDYYFVLTKTTKDDWQTIFNNLGLIQALILSTAYGVSGWISFTDLDDCGNDEDFYIYTNVVQQFGLAGVVISILMVQFAGMAATDETKAEEALGELTPLFIIATIIDAVVTIVMGFAIVLLDENVHQCEYKNEHPGETLHIHKRFPAVFYLRIGVWGSCCAFALLAVVWTSQVTIKYLKPNDEESKQQTTELAVVGAGENAETPDPLPTLDGNVFSSWSVGGKTL